MSTETHDDTDAPASLLTEALNSLPDAVTVLDLDFRVHYLNEAAAEYLRSAGIERTAMIGRVLDEVLPPSTVEPWMKALRTAVAEHRIVSFEGHSAPMGRWTETRIVPSATLLTAYTRDLTKRHEAERRADESSALLHAILNNTTDAIFVKDLEGRLLAINAVGAAALHRTPDEVIGHTLDDFLGAEGAAPMRESEIEVLRTGRTDRREEPLFVDGVRRDFLTSRGIWRDANGVVAGIVGMSTNITERRQREQANSLLAEAGRVLAESLDYRVTLNAVAHLVAPAIADWCSLRLLNADGQLESLAVAHADPELEQSAREMLMRYPDLVDTSISASAVVRTGQSTVFTEIGDELLATLAHDEAHLALLQRVGMRSAMVVPMRAHGRTLGAMSLIAGGSGRCFTERDLPVAEELARRSALAIENSELFLAAAAANRVKSEFLASISHELRTPLNAILGYTQLLSDGITGPVTDAQHNQLLRIRASATHLLGLIDEVLSFSRLEAGREQPALGDVDVAEVLDDAISLVRPLAAAKKLPLQIDSPYVAGGTLHIETDVLKLRQILVNLLTNAVKFTDRGVVTLGARLDGGDVLFTVSDTGIGISPQHVERVFEPFWQVQQAASRRVGGTGLGLSVTRRLARLLGGDVRVDSVPGDGSTFEVRLPRESRA
jgi:PAS domain S-box-containing protein